MVFGGQVLSSFRGTTTLQRQINLVTCKDTSYFPFHSYFLLNKTNILLLIFRPLFIFYNNFIINNLDKIKTI